MNTNIKDLCTKIDKLNISKATMDILKNNEIKTAKDLSDCSRIELMELGIEKAGILEVIISLQLLGLNIKPKYKSVLKAK